MPTPTPTPDEIPRDMLPGTPLADQDTTELTDADRAAADAAAAQRSADVEENCFWQKTQGPICVLEQLRERWCYICCEGLMCETVYCEWRVVGTC